MRFKEFNIVSKSAPVSSTELQGSPQATTLVKPAIKKQKKWVPPLQQMLDLLKQSVVGQQQKSTGNVIATAVDPAMCLSESINEDISFCHECGHLNVPQNLEESKATRIQEKWDKMSSKITGGTQKCNHH